MRGVLLNLALITLASSSNLTAAEPDLARDILPLLTNRCVKCHGPGKQEAGLNLSTPADIARGGENGAVVEPGELDVSLLWHRVDGDEMPPEDPLPADEKKLLEAWIAAGAKGLPESNDVGSASSQHCAFRHLHTPALPAVRDQSTVRTDVDRFILARLEADDLELNPPADRPTLIRRVAFDLTGLPPTPQEIKNFLDDPAPDAYQRMVERYLASPHYGQRWGKYWLDAAGYADSNGYFNADTDRPLAYRYRDYVVGALNEDKPFDRFVLEQIAGDELSGFVPGQDATPETISLLEATHYLRNGQDGTGESDGNPDEVRIDRYSVLEATSQIVATSLLGLTMQCCKCHDHKFEPISQRDYYRLQSVFYPAFNVGDWTKPNDRYVYANLPGEVERWEARARRIDEEIAALRSEFAEWVRAHRPPSTVLFHDEFAEAGPPLADNWSNTAPGDDAPGGTPAVALDSPQAPAAARRDGSLQILESGSAGDRWLSTKQSFDWTPDENGQWVQVTFDLVSDRAAPDATPAARIAYFLALHDFDDSASTAGGNVLIDGNPAGGAAVHVDYPGADGKQAGTLGEAKYEFGHNYGVRITNVGENKFRLEHLVDSVPDEATLELPAADLPDGGFGFEYCCGRSFVVDNVVIEHCTADSAGDTGSKELVATIRDKRRALTEAVQAKQRERGTKPGKISCVFEKSADPPDVFLLQRGNYGSPGEQVQPAPLSALADADETLSIEPPFEGATSSGRRLAWARWVTRPGSRPAALMARVQANRIWQHHFGTGIVATPDNLGTSGSPPSHPQLLEYLAARLVTSGWSIKTLHREILASAVYRQTSTLHDAAFKRDPDNRLLWRFGLQRLDGEALRDAMLAVSGGLDAGFGGPYVPTTRDTQGEIIVNPDAPGAMRRSLYLQQRRTQTLSFLGVFDSPSIVFNCVQRPTSTIPLQSLSLLNSDFVVARARQFAERLAREAPGDDASRIGRAFLLAVAREPTQIERDAAAAFVATQRSNYSGTEDSEQHAWADFCQMLLASNAFLYIE